MLLRFLLAAAGVAAVLGCQQATLSAQPASQSAVEPATPAGVLDTYVRIARAAYGDSLTAAQALDSAIDDLLASPSEQTLRAAKDAWLAARVPYMQTEVYRFGNPVVDEWEIRVNSWPLDEGLIDYTADSYGETSDTNYFYSANLIANEQINVGGYEIDASTITGELLADTLHQIDGVEANVATGYHAIEFLLWGQDLNGTDPGNGNRPYTDYSLENCSHGNCDRRRDYLKAASTLLVSDLREMVGSWQAGGAAHEDLMGKGEESGLATILTGMGSLSYGELAGERTRLALLLNDPEEEHDCFSDNTHHSHYYDARGIANIYRGEYERIDGSVVSGPSIEDLVEQAAPEVDAEMERRLAETEAAMQALVDQAEMGNTFDVLIGFDSEDGEAVISRIVDALVAQTRTIEDIVVALELENISIQGSDSLDPTSAL